MDDRREASGKRTLPANPGVILSTLDRAARAVYKKTDESMIGHALTSYDAVCEQAEGSLSSRIAGKLGISARIIKPIKRSIASAVEHSAIFNYIGEILDSLLSCSVRVWGIFTMSFGLYTALVFLIRSLAFTKGEANIMTLYTAAAIVLLSIPLMMAGGTLASAVTGSRIASFVLFRMIGVSRERFEREREVIGRSNIAFFCGMILGLLTFFLSPVLILIGLVGLTTVYLVLQTPEIGVIAAIFITPFSPHSMPLALLVVFITLCYIIKLMLGKRTVRFELFDATVLAFMAVTFFGGIFSVSPETSLKPAMLLCVFMCGYFLTVNLLRTTEWMLRAVGAFVISSFLVAALGVYENFFGTLSTTWQDAEMFSDIEGRVISTFGNPNVLAEFIIMTLPLTAAIFLCSKGASGKLASFALFACGGGCLIYTWSRGAWLGFMFAVMFFILLYSYRSMILIFFGIGLLPFLPFILPESIISRFTSIGSVADSSTSYRIHIWEACLKLAKDNLAGGIGIGEGAFALVYPRYTLAGIESAPHSHNLYLQITIECGIFGLLIFLALLFLFFQSGISFIKHKSDYPETVKMKHAKVICLAGMSGIFAILVQGMTDYVWYNYRVFFIFWLCLGVTMAARRSAISERVQPEEDPLSLELPLDTETKPAKHKGVNAK